MALLDVPRFAYGNSFLRGGVCDYMSRFAYGNSFLQGGVVGANLSEAKNRETQKQTKRWRLGWFFCNITRLCLIGTGFLSRFRTLRLRLPRFSL